MQKNNFKSSLTEYAKYELQLIGFMESPFGETCLEFLDKCADISNCDPQSMKTICEILPRLIDKLPLSAITEKDFKPETYIEGNKSVEISRCTRYPYLYKFNDKYYDDRAVAFRKKTDPESDRMYIYQSGNSSKKEVELPYFPIEKLIVLD